MLLFIKNFIPLLFLLVIIGYLIYTVPKKGKPSAFYYSLAILGASCLLYYMMVFLGFEVLGNYSLTNLTQQEKKILKVKEQLDSLEIHKENIMNQINQAKIEMEHQLNKIAVYTNETAKTTLKMQSHLERQKEIEKIISDFDLKLSQITQELITFSFIIGNKPLLAFGGMTPEYKLELEDLTRSLGQQLMFNADSLLKDIEKRGVELNNEHLQRKKQLK